MRKLIVSTLMTLDGVVEDPGGFSDFSLGVWGNALLRRRGPAARPEHVAGRRPSAVWASDLRILFKVLALRARPVRRPLEQPAQARRLDDAERTLEWNAKVIEGDVAEEVGRLKVEDGGDIVMYGSTNLMYTLMRHDLIDEYRIWVYPWCWGPAGRTQGPPPGQHPALGSGVVVTYHPHSPPT